MSSKVAKGLHPVELAKFKLATPSTAALEEFIGVNLRHGIPGCVVHGKSRHGKSDGVEFVASQLEVPCISFLCEGWEESPNLRDHYYWMLESVGHELRAEGTGPEKRTRFREYLISRISESGQHRIVYFFDEAQHLREDQWMWLMSDYNFQVKQGYRPLYVFVGQPELTRMRTAFIQAGVDELVGRFMVNMLEYRGIRDEHDIAEILTSYDERAEFPIGEGISYTRHFFPAAFEAGWRLGQMAPVFWQAYTEINLKHTISLRADIGLQWFIPAVNYLLIEHRNDVCTVPDITLASVKEAIEFVGYVSAMRGVKPPRKAAAAEAMAT